jgi:hypothetical protein
MCDLVGIKSSFRWPHPPTPPADPTPRHLPQTPHTTKLSTIPATPPPSTTPHEVHFIFRKFTWKFLQFSRSLIYIFVGSSLHFIQVHFKIFNLIPFIFFGSSVHFLEVQFISSEVHFIFLGSSLHFFGSPLHIFGRSLFFGKFTSFSWKFISFFRSFIHVYRNFT